MTSALSLSIKPNTWTFPKQGGLAHFKLISSVNKKQAFILSVTQKASFTVKPDSGFVAPNGTLEVNITAAANAKTDELVIQFADVDASVTDPKSIEKLPTRFEIGIPLKIA